MDIPFGINDVFSSKYFKLIPQKLPGKHMILNYTTIDNIFLQSLVKEKNMKSSKTESILDQFIADWSDLEKHDFIPTKIHKKIKRRDFYFEISEPYDRVHEDSKLNSLELCLYIDPPDVLKTNEKQWFDNVPFQKSVQNEYIEKKEISESTSSSDLRTYSKIHKHLYVGNDCHTALRLKLGSRSEDKECKLNSDSLASKEDLESSDIKSTESCDIISPDYEEILPNVCSDSITVPVISQDSPVENICEFTENTNEFNLKPECDEPSPNKTESNATNDETIIQTTNDETIINTTNDETIINTTNDETIIISNDEKIIRSNDETIITSNDETIITSNDESKGHDEHIKCIEIFPNIEILNNEVIVTPTTSSGEPQSTKDGLSNNTIKSNSKTVNVKLYESDFENVFEEGENKDEVFQNVKILKNEMIVPPINSVQTIVDSNEHKEIYLCEPNVNEFEVPYAIFSEDVKYSINVPPQTDEYIQSSQPQFQDISDGSKKRKNSGKKKKKDKKSDISKTICKKSKSSKSRKTRKRIKITEISCNNITSSTECENIIFDENITETVISQGSEIHEMLDQGNVVIFDAEGIDLRNADCDNKSNSQLLEFASNVLKIAKYEINSNSKVETPESVPQWENVPSAEPHSSKLLLETVDKSNTLKEISPLKVNGSVPSELNVGNESTVVDINGEDKSSESNIVAVHEETLENGYLVYKLYNWYNNNNRVPFSDVRYYYDVKQGNLQILTPELEETFNGEERDPKQSDMANVIQMIPIIVLDNEDFQARYCDPGVMIVIDNGQCVVSNHLPQTMTNEQKTGQILVSDTEEHRNVLQIEELLQAIEEFNRSNFLK